MNKQITGSSTRRRSLRSFLAICALGLLAVTLANASPITFASYGETTGDNQWLLQTSGGTTTLLASGFVDFKAFAGPLDGTTTAAILALNASTTTAGAILFGSFYGQPDYAGTFSFTGIAGPTAGKNLLSGTFTSAVLTGTIGADGASFTGMSTLADLTQLTFTSDYFLFGAKPESASFSLSGMNPAFSVSGGYPGPGSFVAAGTGTFSAEVVPEPVSLCLVGGGLLVLGIVRRKKVARP